MDEAKEITLREQQLLERCLRTVLRFELAWCFALSFVFVLFFHCGSKFTTSGTRVVNIVNVSGDWLFGQWQ